MWHRPQRCSRRCARDRGPLGGRGRQGRGRGLVLSARIIMSRLRGRWGQRLRRMRAKSAMKRKKEPLPMATRTEPKALLWRACFAIGAGRWCFGLVEGSSAGPRQNGQICYGKSGMGWRWDGEEETGIAGSVGVDVDGLQQVGGATRTSAQLMQQYVYPGT